MNTKLKQYVVGLSFIIGCLILSFSGKYDTNAVIKSTASCMSETNENRGLKDTYKILKLITPEPTPTETPTKAPTEAPKKVKHKTKNKSYTNEDLRMLAGIIENEAGSDFCSNSQQRYCASVVLNRVKHDYYPDTIKEVIFQKGQYAIGKHFKTPSKRAYKNAKYILEHGSIIPSDCIFQSEFRQGDYVYKIFKTKISTTYICGVKEK